MADKGLPTAAAGLSRLTVPGSSSFVTVTVDRTNVRSEPPSAVTTVDVVFHVVMTVRLLSPSPALSKSGEDLKVSTPLLADLELLVVAPFASNFHVMASPQVGRGKGRHRILPFSAYVITVVHLIDAKRASASSSSVTMTVTIDRVRRARRVGRRYRHRVLVTVFVS